MKVFAAIGRTCTLHTKSPTDLNSEGSCCEASVLTTAPCCPHYKQLGPLTRHTSNGTDVVKQQASSCIKLRKSMATYYGNCSSKNQDMIVQRHNKKYNRSCIFFFFLLNHQGIERLSTDFDSRPLNLHPGCRWKNLLTAFAKEKVRDQS